MATDDTTASRGTPSRARVIAIAVLVLLVVVGGLAWLIVWAANRTPERVPVSAADAFSAHRDAWTSAMRKAGVDATYPAGPVELQTLVVSGRQPLDATFTGEEVSALAAVYPFRADALGADVEVTSIEVAFPEPGVARISGSVSTGGSTYDFDATAPARYSNGRIELDQAGAELTVEGFGVGGSRKTQAIETFSVYLNDLVAAAPGLEVDAATIDSSGLSVTGSVPKRLENPNPPGDAP